ncbi:Gfo/Idh/MocA family oxidoreductase, partial [Candidatus Poribacteria bacterium]|nr:Gfo/Idh/MocA family oxidoreductase [Candidatus Poribacteria bacterium]
KVLLISKDELGTKPGREQSSKGNVELGFIGAGSFARAFLLPNLKDNDSVIFRGVATGSSVNSKHVARKYKFQYCTTDYNEILQDQEVMAVVVATRHNLHAKIVIEAIKAHKAVFVEKPLAISEDELIDVIQTWKDNEGRIMVGFNRRFSPFIEQVKSFFSDRTQPLAINYRINAGSVAKEHWVQDADQGGGRIIGEVCHFVDLLQFLVGSQPLRIFAESISANSEAVVDNDNISITLKFADGSIGNVSYLANGDSSFPKERIEIFGDGSIAVIDDFKELQLIKKGKTEKIKKRGQNKGHRKELRMFVNAVKNGEDMPIPFRDSVVATTLTFMIHKSLREGIPLDVDLERFGL